MTIPASPAGRSRRARARRLIVGLLAAACLTVLAGLFLRRSPADSASGSRTAPVEVARAELVLTSGRLVRTGETKPFTGLMTEHYPDGSLQSRSAIVEGVLEGISEGWYPGGHLQSTEPFRTGVSHGTRTRWYADGTRQSEARIEQGRIEGVFRRWHTNGVLAEQVEMRHGEPEGVSVAWHPSGFLRARAVVRDGRVTEQESWKDGEKRETSVALAEPVR